MKLHLLLALILLSFTACADGNIIPDYFVFMYFLLVTGVSVIAVVSVVSVILFLRGRKNAFKFSLVCAGICYFSTLFIDQGVSGTIYILLPLGLFVILFLKQISNDPLKPAWYIACCTAAIMFTRHFLLVPAMDNFIKSYMYLQLLIWCSLLFFFSWRFLNALFQRGGPPSFGELFRKSCRITVGTILIMMGLMMIHAIFSGGSFMSIEIFVAQTVFGVVLALAMSGLSTYLVTRRRFPL